MQNIKVIEVGLLELKVIDKPLEVQEWGFLLQPNFKETGINLRIRFDLLVPLNKTQHIFCMTVTGFFLEYFNAEYLKTEIETITGLIQTAMANTRLILMQKGGKNISFIPMNYFDNKYFEDELRAQLKELNL